MPFARIASKIRWTAAAFLLGAWMTGGFDDRRASPGTAARARPAEYARRRGVFLC